MRLSLLTIPAHDGLDTINVIFQDLTPGVGRIWVECYGNAWTCYWGAMGQAVQEFVAGCDVSYLVGGLMAGRQARTMKRDRDYLERICAALLGALKSASLPEEVQP